MIILGTNSIKDTGFDVANSCRFNGDAYVHKAVSAGNQRTFTYSFWTKRSTLNNYDTFIGYAGTAGGGGGTNRGELIFVGDGDDTLRVGFNPGGSSWSNYTMNTGVFRDTSAWYNIVLKVNTTSGTEAERLKIFVNGVSQGLSGYPGQNFDTGFNVNGNVYHVGRSASGTGNFIKGYLAEAVFIDGTALDADSFGEFDDSGIWKPIDVSGLTFGTNGFYLDFEDSSNLGNDANGGTDLTEVNLAATDQSTDTCTNNMPTINQLTLHSNGVTVSEGNLVATTGDAPWQSTNCTFGLTTGKWYWEFKATESSTNQYLVLGIQSDNLLSSAANGFGYSNNYSYGFKNYNGEFVYNETDGGGSGSYGNAVTDGQIVGVALDLVNLKIYFSINGTYQNSGDPTSGSTGTGSPVTLQSGQTYFPSLVIARAGGTGTIPIGEYNFGSPPYSESGGNSDGNGYGNFKTAPPSGYYSLNTKNLAEYG